MNEVSERWRAETLTANGTRLDSRVDPSSESSDRFVDRPITQRDDEAGLLGDRDEHLRHHQADLAVRPPGERLETHDRAGADIDLRLKVELQSVAIDRLPQPRLHGVSCLRSYREVRREQLERVPAARLCSVHRAVGVLEERLHVGPVRRVERNPDARRRVQLVTPCEERLREHLDDLGGRRNGSLFVLGVADENGELVATHSRDGVGLAHGLP